jgi:Spy/CpxP family protein refolding chaperone
MKNRISCKLWALGVFFAAAALLLPTLGQARAESRSRPQEWKAQLAKEMKLSPEKEAKFVAMGDKYANLRQQLYEKLKKNQEALTAALAAAKPDEAKVKELVKVITGDQNELLTIYKMERDEEMALLSPLEQGRYLSVLHHWRQQMYEKHAMSQAPPKGEKPKK